MHFTPVALLSLLGAAQALAPPKILGFDDVIVPSDDGKSFSVMKDYEYGIQKSKREMMDKRAMHDAPTIPSAAELQKRCDENNEVQVLTDTSFTNWDVAMSPVISNTGSSMATVSVSKGYEVGNTLSVSIPDVPGPNSPKRPHANQLHNRSQRAPRGPSLRS